MNAFAAAILCQKSPAIFGGDRGSIRYALHRIGVDPQLIKGADSTAFKTALKKMGPALAAQRVAEMFAWVFDDDLAGVIASDLRLNRDYAKRIAIELLALRRPAGGFLENPPA